MKAKRGEAATQNLADVGHGEDGAARAGDNMAAERCRTLDKTAADCAACRHCDGRCPFHVKQSARMAEIREYFGR